MWKQHTICAVKERKEAIQFSKEAVQYVETCEWKACKLQDPAKEREDRELKTPFHDHRAFYNLLLH